MGTVTELHKNVVPEELKYPVIEIFDSIQGEGAMMGIPVSFIRVAGCNLACPWCDTKESWQKPCRHENIEYCSTEEMRASDMLIVTPREVDKS